MYLTNAGNYLHIFEDARHNGLSSDTVRLPPTPVNSRWRPITGNTCHCGNYGVDERNREIPTAVFTFSGMPNPTDLAATLPDFRRRQNIQDGGM